MFILYDELFWTDEHGNRKHDCVKTKFESLAEAKAEMEYQFELSSPGNNSTLLLDRSALIIHHDKDDRYDRLIQLAISEEA